MAGKAQAFQQACRLQHRISAGRPPHETTSTLSKSTARSAHQIFARREFHIGQPCAIAGHKKQRRSLVLLDPARRYASSSSPGQNRRAISVTSDDGRYQWSELSTGEKASRSTQQTFNFLIVSGGAVLTLTVFYLLYTELFAPDSSTIQFNAAVSRIKASPECRALLGPSRQIKAYGEPTSNKWARARPLAHSSEVDRFGTAHLRMHFNVEGPQGTGVVNVHMTRPKGADTLEYQILSLNVKGHETVFLENKDAERGVKGKVSKMFGVQWR